MRLTPDLIRTAVAYMNPLKEREVSLRGMHIPSIENLGVTQNAFEVIDLSNNELVSLENFPLLKRLKTLLLSNNHLRRIQRGLGKYLPNLSSLILTANNFTSIEDLKPLSDLSSLHTLSLIDNPVTKASNYRLYVIHRCPKVKVLDFRKVTQKEREAAKARYGELNLKEEEKEVQEDTSMVNQEEKSKSFTPGGEGKSAAKALSAEQRAEVMAQIKAATSLEEIERLEKLLEVGAA